MATPHFAASACPACGARQVCSRLAPRWMVEDGGAWGRLAIAERLRMKPVDG